MILVFLLDCLLSSKLLEIDHAVRDISRKQAAGFKADDYEYWP